jgi:hypothetical protein
MTDRRSPYLAVVHRDYTEVFAFLQRHFAHDSVEVLWDRRIDERRGIRGGVAPERRRGDRRRPPPLTWTTLGMLLIAPTQHPLAEPQPGTPD